MWKHKPENEPQQLEDYFLGNVAMYILKIYTKVFRNGGFLQIRSKDSQVKTQLVLWIFIIINYKYP
jgi:hypothetical protein